MHGLTQRPLPKQVFASDPSGRSGGWSESLELSGRVVIASVRSCFGGGAYSTDDSVILVRRDSTAQPNSHAFRDESIWTVASGVGSYATFDARTSYLGAAAFNHLHGFQARVSYGGSLTLNDLIGHWSENDHSGSGTVSQQIGYWAKNPTGAGTITINYGLKVESQTRGSTNYAIYTGTGQNVLGDALDLAGNMRLTGGNRTIGTDTSDGADTRFIVVASSGAAGDSRGGFFDVIGNEFGTAALQGCVEFYAGYDAGFANVNAGSLRFYTGGGEKGRFWRSGGLEVRAGLTTDPGASSILAGGSIRSDGTAGVGYATGAGGTVTQATSKSTGVTLNKTCGTITLNNASLAATTSVAFTLTNSTIAATDVIVVNIKSGATANSYFVSVDAVAAGSCSISLRNYTAGALGEAVVLSFAVIKAVAA